jgi:hypothetical protein
MNSALTRFGNVQIAVQVVQGLSPSIFGTRTTKICDDLRDLHHGFLPKAEETDIYRAKFRDLLG